MNDSTLLEVQELSVGFRAGKEIRPAVEEISFEVIAGRTLAIVGESGSGKSVSSLSLMQLLQLNKAVFENGRFLISGKLNDGEEIVARPDDERLVQLRGKGIAMIFQEPMTSLNPVLTCGSQVAEMLRIHKKINDQDARKRTIELFEEVKLPRPEEMFDQYPHQLSGGQRQRVMIAMAISCEPLILIADEPTTALDVTVQKNILDLLKSLQVRYNMGMIFITHDLGVVADIADDILVMRRGAVVEKGNAKQVLHDPQHPYTKGLLACRPTPGKKTGRLKTIEDQQTSVDVQDSFTVKDSSAGTVLLSVKNASKIYSSEGGLFRKKGQPVYAVNEVSFDITKGETLGLVGESGCGKTTLSRMLLGLIPATSGEIIFDGSDITKLSKPALRALRKEIQIIFQDPYSSLNPRHTIGESIMEPMTVYGLHGNTKSRRARVMALLHQVGLKEEFFGRYPHEFSGGQRQRIVIARALAVEPSFIICDESVSALDVSVQAQVLNLLNDLKRDHGLTYLFISHDLSVVYHMSDRIMVMNKGKIEEVGPADEVFHHPQSEYTQRLITSIPGINALP